MKKLSYFLSAMMIIAAIATGCKSKEKIAAPPPPQPLPKGEVLINNYCAGEKEFMSTKELFRASAVGESMDQMVSKKKAMTNVKGELAGLIQTTMKGVTDNYIKSTEANNVEGLEERFEGNTREVINQQLNGVRVICEKQTKTADGNYKTYICIEITAEDIVKGIGNKLSADKELKIDYDYEKFKKTFDEEMQKMENR
jgi:hypothetical protein